MSEMVLVVPVIALTAVVLLGILFVFRKYLALRDELDAESARTRSAPREQRVPEKVVRVHTGAGNSAERAAA